MKAIGRVLGAVGEFALLVLAWFGMRDLRELGAFGEHNYLAYLIFGVALYFVGVQRARRPA